LILSVNFSSITYSVKDKSILRGISFDVSPDKGEIIGILGPSGSGKSTLLKLMNGLISPSSGKITVGDKDIDAWERRELRKSVGMVMQRPYLFAGTVRDNLIYGPVVNGKDITEEAMVRLLDEAGLDASFLDKKTGKLSGGEQQRVSIARTLANDPCIILLDEPTSSLDIASEEVVEEILISLKTERLLFLVSHDLEQTKRLCDRVMVINQGKLDKDMPAEKFFQIYNHETLREYFKNSIKENNGQNDNNGS